jgi:hypothetical protein
MDSIRGSMRPGCDAAGLVDIGLDISPLECLPTSVSFLKVVTSAKIGSDGLFIVVQWRVEPVGELRVRRWEGR